MDWNRPITPAHALAFVGGCAVVGFLSGIGICGLLAMAGWQRFRDALGW